MADQKMAKGKHTAAGKQAGAGTKKQAGAAGKKNTASGRPAKKAGSGARADGKGQIGSAYEPEERLSDSMKEEIVLAVTLLVALLFFLSYINLCGTVGTWLNTIIFGLFGIFGYLFPFLLFFGVAFGISNRKNRIARRKLWCAAGAFVCLAALVELLSAYDPELKWAKSFTVSAETKSGGGILGGTLVRLLCPLFDTVATTVILIILLLICLMLVTGKEIFSYIRNMADGAVTNRRGAALEEEAYQEEFAEEGYEEITRQAPRVITFQKSGKEERADALAAGGKQPKEEPVRFVDALKARGKKGKGQKEAPYGTAEEVALVQNTEETPKTAPVEEVVPPQCMQEITITGDYQKENVPFYEEELKRKFGGTEGNSATVERKFYDVSVSKDGSTVKENDVVLIYKELYGDDEPIIPPKPEEKETETADRNKPADAGTEGDDFVVSADMIFANAGIDPAVREFAKMEETQNQAISAGVSAAEEGGTVLAFPVKENPPQRTPDFWPDMSVDQGGALPSTASEGGIVKVVPQAEMGIVGDSSGDAPETALDQENFFGGFGTAYPDEDVPDLTPSELQYPVKGGAEGFPNAVRQAVPAAPASCGAPRADAGAAGTPRISGGSAALSLVPFPVPEKKYEFPPIDLLAKPVQGKGANERELKETAAKLQSTLQSFGVRVTITNISCGPAVTQYELQPEQGVKVNQITKLSDDIKLNLAATDIRIEAPIPGKAAIGIEVPNKENTPVILRELLESEEFKKHKSRLAFAVGKNISGQIVVSDIAKMPHMLIAGATGSGKSVCINTIIMSILYKADPKDVKLIMVDPKVVELSVYNGIPHLLIPVVTDPKKASAALNWAVAEMTDRYQKFAALSVRDLTGYNEKVGAFDEPNPAFPRLPQIVIIVDELADLMMVASANEVEDAICRLAQMARAAGLHLIIATQRPSVNVITGVIKANVPSRVAFAVTSAVDSRTILDGVGAERLLGKGDMLFFPSGYPKPVRIQGAFVSDAEVSKVVDFLKEQTEGAGGYNEEINQRIMTATSGGDGASALGGDGNDDYFAEAGKFIIEKQKASIGMLQRVYKIGFNRAARIMDQLTAAGVVGPEEGTKPRKILMTQLEFEEYLKTAH